MADNKTVDNGALTDIPVATDEVTYSGDTVDVQIVRPAHVTGSEGSKTVVDITTSEGQKTVGAAAHDAAVAGNPVMVGGRAQATDPTDVSDAGDAVRAWFLLNGAQVVKSLGDFITVSTDLTRQAADTTQYSINDAMSDSTSAPTSGGFTFTNAARKSGGSGIITDAIITTSADQGTLPQGELWLFNQSVTNINDNTAFAVSDAEIKTCVGKIAWTLEDAGNNGFFHATNLNIGFTCVGSANLRFLVRMKNAYTPVGSEVFTFTLKIVRVD